MTKKELTRYKVNYRININRNNENISFSEKKEAELKEIKETLLSCINCKIKCGCCHEGIRILDKELSIITFEEV